MRAALLLVPLVVLASAAPGGAAGDAAAPYFPVAPGNRWVLRDSATGVSSSISVRGDMGRLVLRGFPGAGDLRVRQVGQAIQAWDASDVRWEAFLRLGLPAGAKYLVDLQGTGLWRGTTVTISSRHDTVDDYRGASRRNCVTLTFAYRKPIADAGLEAMSFAPAVGPVLVREQTIAGTRERLLDRYVARRPT